MAVDNI